MCTCAHIDAVIIIITTTDYVVKTYLYPWYCTFMESTLRQAFEEGRPIPYEGFEKLVSDGTSKL